ncbi:nuclear transport factor 2 family protein [Novosphingopyxis sp.]|uniref:nuclear transport factor 2 family protein n=1 Tax=Novosphingopyxis sp. TaxID=2709690 RepID=UPI003B594D88
MRFPMVQPVTDMTRASLGDRLAPGVDEYLDMFHEDAVFEFPFGMGGGVRKEGKSAMADFLAEIAGSTIFYRFDLKEAHPINAGGMVLEYHARASAGESKTPFEQDYVAVAQTHGGRIGLYREYLDPLNIPGVIAKAASTPLDDTPLDGPTTDLEAMLKGALGDQLNLAGNSFLDLFAENAVLECPFAPPGAMRRLQGKDAISAYYERLTAVQKSDGMVQTGHYPAEDKHMALLEYEGLVRDARDGDVYRQKYLAIAKAESGRLTLFREYWNPLPVLAAFGPGGPAPMARR